jgi:hypothetical protein
METQWLCFQAECKHTVQLLPFSYVIFIPFRCVKRRYICLSAINIRYSDTSILWTHILFCFFFCYERNKAISSWSVFSSNARSNLFFAAKSARFPSVQRTKIWDRYFESLNTNLFGTTCLFKDSQQARPILELYIFTIDTILRNVTMIRLSIYQPIEIWRN